MFCDSSQEHEMAMVGIEVNAENRAKCPVAKLGNVMRLHSSLA